MWDRGEGREAGLAALPSPPGIGEDFSGVSRVGVGAARQPTLQTQRLLSWRGGESAILSNKHWPWLRLAPYRKPPARRGSVQPGGGLQGVSGRAPAVSGPGFPQPRRPPPP